MNFLNDILDTMKISFNTYFYYYNMLITKEVIKMKPWINCAPVFVFKIFKLFIIKKAVLLSSFKIDFLVHSHILTLYSVYSKGDLY